MPYASQGGPRIHFEVEGAGALVELNQRLATLRATLGFLSLEPREPELRSSTVASTRGAGSVQYDLELRRYNGRRRVA